MSVVISAKGLSKRYRICHETRAPAYATIVESLTRKAKEWKQRVFKPFCKSLPLPKRSFEDFWALKEASFEICQGDRVGIIGENGAGKSTLLKILSRIIEPSEGSVTIQGRIASLLEVGTGFHPELSGRENIFLNGAILGMEKREIIARFDEIVAFSEVEKFLDTPVKYYSSGMYARLGFAIAAHLDPDILIVDEVLAVGDSRFQEKCLKKLDSVSKEGRTVLFVSHSTQALSALCNKGILLEKGRVAASGDIENVLSFYLKETKHQAFHWKGSLGNETLKITSVAIDHEREFFYQNEKAQLTITCELVRPLGEALFGIEIKNGRQQTVFYSFLNRTEDIFSKNAEPGIYQLSCILDFQILWEGEYTLQLHYSPSRHEQVPLDAISLRFPVYPVPSELPYIDQSHLNGLHYPLSWQTIPQNIEAACRL